MLLNNRYLILQPLGQRGCAETLLAEDTQIPSKRKCVVKKFKPSLGNTIATQEIKKKFEKEAQILEVLGKHELIPELYAFFEENGEMYIAQQFIEGMTVY